MASSLSSINTKTLSWPGIARSPNFLYNLQDLSSNTPPPVPLKPPKYRFMTIDRTLGLTTFCGVTNDVSAGHLKMPNARPQYAHIGLRSMSTLGSKFERLPALKSRPPVIQTATVGS